MPTERDEPRISVNKLGEYMLAGARRRRRIVVDQREPKNFLVPIYTPAEEAISRYLVGGGTDRDIIDAEIRRLSMREPGERAWVTERNGLCVDALEAFRDLADDFDLEGFEVRAGDTGGGLSIGGVYVSVRPEVLLRQPDGKGGFRQGAIKLYLVKSYPHSDASAAFVGTTVLEYLRQEREQDGKVDPELCLVVDVFGGEVFTAPKAYKSRLKELEAACEEIRGRWNS